MGTHLPEAHGPAAELVLNFLVRPEDDQYTALCVELDIASCGPTEEEAIESLTRLVELYVDDCVDHGEFPIALRPVPADVLRTFLAPPPSVGELRIRSITRPLSHAAR